MYNTQSQQIVPAATEDMLEDDEEEDGEDEVEDEDEDEENDEVIELTEEDHEDINQILETIKTLPDFHQEKMLQSVAKQMHMSSLRNPRRRLGVESNYKSVSNA